jgi:hypothetical protein
MFRLPRWRISLPTLAREQQVSAFANSSVYPLNDRRFVLQPETGQSQP